MYRYTILLLLPVLICAQDLDSLHPYDKSAEYAFGHIDTDGSGNVSSPELHDYFQRYDADQNGEVTPAEFHMFIQNTDLDNHFKGIENALYEFFDVNGDNQLTEVDFNHLFLMTDYNSDGEVTKSEFVVISVSPVSEVPFTLSSIISHTETVTKLISVSLSASSVYYLTH